MNKKLEMIFFCFPENFRKRNFEELFDELKALNLKEQQIWNEKPQDIFLCHKIY